MLQGGYNAGWLLLYQMHLRPSWGSCCISSCSRSSFTLVTAVKTAGKAVCSSQDNWVGLDEWQHQQQPSCCHDVCCSTRRGQLCGLCASAVMVNHTRP